MLTEKFSSHLLKASPEQGKDFCSKHWLKNLEKC